jgi:hypothetical protein
MDDARVPLASGERLLWTGRPDRSRWLTSSDVYLIPFSVIWCGFIAFWEYSATTFTRAPGMFVVVGSLFALFGIYQLIGRFAVGRYLRMRTTYTITDRRIIAMGPRSARSIPVGGDVTRRPSGDGRRVTYVFAAAPGAGSAWLSGSRAMAFSPLTGMNLFASSRRPQPLFLDDVEDHAGADAALAGTATPTRVG